MLDFKSVTPHHNRFFGLIRKPLALVLLSLLFAMASFSGAPLVDSAAAQSIAAAQRPLNAKQRRLLAARLSDGLKAMKRDYAAGRKLVIADLNKWTDNKSNPAVARIFNPKELPRPIPDGTNIYEAAIKDYVEAQRKGKVWNPWPDDKEGANHQRDYARCVLQKVDYVFETKWKDVEAAIMEVKQQSDPSSNLRSIVREALAWNVVGYLKWTELPVEDEHRKKEAIHPRRACPGLQVAGEGTAVNSDPLSVRWSAECLPSDKDQRTGKVKPYHPTTAALMFDDGAGFASYCSGTLIAPNAVLTAAHCVCDTGAKDNYGQFYRTSSACVNGGYMRRGREFSTHDPKFQTVFLQHAGHFEISRVVVHPQFRWTDQLPISDLAILFLKKPVPDIVPMKINTVGKLPPKSTGVAVGYGAHNPISASGQVTDTGTVLESGGLKLQAKTKTAFCSMLQRKRNYICWRYEPTDRFGMQLGSTCRGDSGGPIYAELNGKAYLAAVVSGGGPSCQPSATAFNFEVFAYRDWIQRQLMENPLPKATSPSVASSPENDSNDGMRQFACHFCALCDQLTASVKTPPSIWTPANTKTSASTNTAVSTKSPASIKAPASRIRITANCTPDDITRRSERVTLTVSKTSGGDNLCPRDPIIGKDVSTAVSCELADIEPEQVLHIKVESGPLQQCQIVATAFEGPN